MYGIFTYIYPKNHPNVGKYSSTMEHLGIITLGIPRVDSTMPWIHRPCRIRAANSDGEAEVPRLRSSTKSTGGFGQIDSRYIVD